jgi:phage protein D
MSTVRTPKFEIDYNGKAVTAELTPFIVSVNYTDKEVGESDDISITLEDSDDTWLNEWWPTKGDTVKLRFGYDDLLVDAGEFKVDEIEISGPPSVVVLKGLATWTTSAMRSKVSKAYEGQTLKQIAQAIASKHSLTLVGEIGLIRLERSTQNRETDLEYLKRIADEYGYQFSIKGQQLVFVSIFDLEKGAPVVVLDKSDMSSFNMRDKSFATYKKATVKYHNPKDRTLYTADVDSVDNGGGNPFTDETAADTLEIRTKAENKQQAEEKAKVALYRSRAQQVEGSITVEGNPILIAGNNIEIVSMGQLSGKYHITESRHDIDRSGGYKTSLAVKRVGYVEKVKHKSTRKRKEPNYDVRVIQ